MLKEAIKLDGGFLAQYLLRLRGMSKASKMRRFKYELALIDRGYALGNSPLLPRRASASRSMEISAALSASTRP